MAIIGFKPILEIPSRLETFDGCLRVISLEEALREHFGEKSVDKLKEYDPQVEAPINTSFMLQLQYFPDDLLISQEGKAVGRMYSCSGKNVSAVSAQNVSVEHSLVDNGMRLALKLDLNQEQAIRYLKLVFSSSMVSVNYPPRQKIVNGLVVPSVPDSF